VDTDKVVYEFRHFPRLKYNPSARNAGPPASALASNTTFCLCITASSPISRPWPSVIQTVHDLLTLDRRPYRFPFDQALMKREDFEHEAEVRFLTHADFLQPRQSERARSCFRSTLDGVMASYRYLAFDAVGLVRAPWFDGGADQTCPPRTRSVQHAWYIALYLSVKTETRA